MPRYHVTLTPEERSLLHKYRQGKHKARSALIATALLMLDEGKVHTTGEEPISIEKAAELLQVSERSLNNWKRKFVEEGLDFALGRKVRDTPPRPIVFGGDFEAKIIALACTDPPDGRARWTVRLLAEKAVELEIVPTVSTMTVQRALKKLASASQKQVLENPQRAQCLLRKPDGGRSGCLQTPLQSGFTSRLHGRIKSAIDWRGSRSFAGKAR